jgi:hypothetical protein
MFSIARAASSVSQALMRVLGQLAHTVDHHTVCLHYERKQGIANHNKQGTNSSIQGSL